MPNFDMSRQADLKGIEEKLESPDVPARMKRKMRRTRARILEQRKMPEVSRLRRRYLAAVRANDNDLVEKLASQLQKLDARLGLDNRKL